MSLLSDYGLRHALHQGDVRIVPQPEDEDIQPASIDLHLGHEFQVWPIGDMNTYIDPREPQGMTKVTPEAGEPFILEPFQFCIGATAEFIELSPSLAAQIDGKSSLGRLGLFVHSTAGWVDPGFFGVLTLEFFNASGRHIHLWPDMAIGQLIIHRLSSTVTRPYGSPALGSRYHGKTGPAPSMGTQYARQT